MNTQECIRQLAFELIETGCVEAGLTLTEMYFDIIPRRCQMSNAIGRDPFDLACTCEL